MSPTVLTFLSIFLIIVSIAYLFVYTQKRKNNTQKDMGYKVIFLIILLLLSIPIVFSVV